ncbi:flagellar hook-length control protein FliK [Paenisporosarcina sp. NPDC076898]|uniref:flagellar hook-length control protein FliK n=1 Tax=unclassified Paenisporosarcina TaxID=2642018 RepID=UPI003CFE915D
METMSLSFPSNISTSKSVTSKQNSESAKDTVNFAALLGSVTAEGQSASEEKVNVNVNPQGELLVKLQEMLQTLQEIPKDNLSPEEQEMMMDIVQMLSLQTVQLENQLQSVELSQETQVISPSVQEKLVNLLNQIDQEIQKQSSITKSFEAATELAGVENNILADPKKLEQAFKQLIAFIQQLETEQQSATGKQVELQQLREVTKIFKHIDDLPQQTSDQTQLTEIPRNNGSNVDPSRTLSVQSISQHQPQDGSAMRVEVVQSEVNGQVLTGTSTDVAKASHAPIRPEMTTATPTQTPTVRMSNLIEELGGVLKGTFRLNGTQEGTQLKVNISPEHLGHLDIRLTASEGKIAAQIFTSNLLAKEALELQVNQLRNSLLQQGVTIDRIEISQQSSQSSLGQQHAHPDQRFSQQQQKQGNASHNKNGYQRIEEEAAVERNHSSEGLMKVDYTI